MSVILTASDILATDDIVKEFVPTPEWANGNSDSGVFVRGMTANERDQWEYEQTNWDVPVMITDPDDPKKKKQIINPARRSKDWLLTFRARLASLCCCDESGNRIFNDDQVYALGRKNTRPLIRIANKANELSNITDEDMENLRKNLESAQEGASPTD